MKRFLSSPVSLPGPQKMALWLTVTIFVTVLAFAAELAGVPRPVVLGAAAIVIAPLAAVLARIFTSTSQRPKNAAVKVARA